MNSIETVTKQMKELAERMRARVRAFFRSPAGRRAAVAAVFLGTLGVGSLFVWWDARPTIRLVNATHHPLRVRVDDGKRARIVVVPPTSTETSEGGVVLRLAPGSHAFAVIAEAPGAPVPAPVSASLTTYGNYLFAAATDDQCFFIQRTLYGVAGAAGATAAGTGRAVPEEPLPPERRLWALPRTIDAVFSPNPPPLPGDRWSTGGERVALRQRRCDVASPRDP